MTAGNEAKKNKGITNVTRGPLALTAPAEQPGPEEHTYGVAFPFQIAPKLAAAFVCLRNLGYPVGDFENGSDLIVFDDISKVASGKVIQITRNEKYVDPHGQPRINIKYPILGGFVPFGALREDGSPHPHAGTGFGINQGMDFPMIGGGYYDKTDKTTNMIRRTEVRQLSYDAQEFRVVSTEVYEHDSPPKAPGSEWALIWPGLKHAIPDGDDMLYPVFATSNDASTWKSFPMASGVSRWQRLDGKWQPVSFVPVAQSKEAENPRIIYGEPIYPHAMEPSLTRDTDGSLLFTARTMGDETEDHVIRVWRSTDGGASWDLIIDLSEARGQAPMTINHAADDTPYIVGTKLGHEREWLCIWQLNADRTGLEEPITVRNALEEFGPPPTGPIWFMDHPMAAVLQLADGQWHNILSYRNMDRGEHAGADSTPHTGQYLEEVISTGPAIPAWKFD